MRRVPLIVSVRGGPAAYASVAGSTDGTSMNAASFERTRSAAPADRCATTLTVRTPGWSWRSGGIAPDPRIVASGMTASTRGRVGEGRRHDDVAEHDARRGPGQRRAAQDERVADARVRERLLDRRRRARRTRSSVIVGVWIVNT